MPPPRPVTPPARPAGSSTPPHDAPAPLRNVGVSGIIERQKQQQHQSSTTLDSAFRDLDSLMQNAKQVIELADKYVAKLNTQNASTNSSADSASTAQTNELHNLLSTLGIENPVTKQHYTNNEFYRALYKEICTNVLPHSLPNLTSIITLPDLYCLVNRARGTELVSPNDLRSAMLLCNKDPASQYRYKEYSNGVIVIHRKHYTDEVVCSTILSFLYNKLAATGAFVPQPSGKPVLFSTQYVTAYELSRDMKISLPIARQQLYLCEQRQLLCRDVTLEETRFYLNDFAGMTRKKLYSTSIR